MKYRLSPLPGGYYANGHVRISDDLQHLLDGDSWGSHCAGLLDQHELGFSLRSQVLVEGEPEQTISSHLTRRERAAFFALGLVLIALFLMLALIVTGAFLLFQLLAELARHWR